MDDGADNGGVTDRRNADVLPPPEQQQPATTSHHTEVASCFANMASGSLPSFPPMPTSGSSLPSFAPTADSSFFPTPQHQHHSLQWPPTLFEDNLDLLNNDNILLQANHDDLSSLWCPPPLVAASQPQHVALFAGDPELQSNGRYRDAYERINLPPSSSGASSSTSPFFHNGGGDDDSFMDMTDYMIPQGDVTSSYFTPPPAAPQQQPWMWPASTTTQQYYSHEPAAMAAQVSLFDNMRVQANAAPSHFAVPPPPPPQSQFYGHRRQLFMGMQRSRPPFWDNTSRNPIDAVLLGAAPSTRSTAPDAPPRKTAKTSHHRRGAGRPRGSTSKLGARAGKTTTSKAAMIQINIQATTTSGQEQHGPTTTTVAVVAADGKPAGVGGAGGREETEELVEYADTSPTGVRFNPKHKEIVGFLRTKYRGDKLPIDNIKEFDVYQAHPKTIIEKLGEGAENTWYVFSPRSRRYENGGRPARSVGSVGYWKSNSKKAQIAGGEGEVIGEDSVLTFVLGHQPKGEPTDWRMVEYCLPEKQLQPGGKCKPGCRCRRTKPDGKCMLLDEWVICRISCNGEDGGARAKSRHRRRGG